MSPGELRRLCGEADWVTLVLPRKAPPAGYGVRLLNRTGPVGEILNVKELPDGSCEVCARFESAAVLTTLNQLEAAANGK